MKLLENMIIEHGEIREGGILKVDKFLNHMIDINLYCEMGKEFARLFSDKKITKILTIEASGIGIACVTAQHLGNIPVVFAKKTDSKNLDLDVYKTVVHSYTKGKDFTIRVDKRYISPNDSVLIIDDFLATGEATLGLMELVAQAGANVAGVGICIEKAFQLGGERIREKGATLHSLAVVEFHDDGTIGFLDK